MKDETTPFWQRKTTWAALGSIGAGAAGYATHTVNVFEALTLIFQGLMGLGLRSAIEKQAVSDAQV